MQLGVIADDMTGATDVALMLQKAGMRVVQLIGVPSPSQTTLPADAIVVALKSRTDPAAEAVAQSLEALAALRAAGARQILFKYCSTFDSTAQGNIGPVADALADALAAPIALVCPAFPANGRTIFQGHLFVGSEPLDESPMKDHPLTPMRDSSLIRLLAAQTPRKVGLVPFATMNKGSGAVKAALDRLAADGVRYAVADAITDDHLLTLGAAVAGYPLVTGGSGIALGLPGNFGRSSVERAPFSAPAGRMAIVSGSCSAATRGQVAAAKEAGLPHHAVDPRAIAAGTLTAAQLAEWALAQPTDKPALIYATAEPAEVAAVQAEFGREKAGAIVEDALAETAALLVEGGVKRLIAAGGETSGAVIQRLNARALAIGPEIAPGAPWTRVIDGPDIAVALKSGNFGARDFFVSSWSLLDGS
ncbi:3-oxo-tetronate kinase [Terrarubrum flagellatum]|uniref:3-oxo-tetronate kinase n=1 Tax=Terrirubrum flagellatum TaxID=2895980 RepID=UPI00314544E6